jgi:hypothetical protein
VPVQSSPSAQLNFSTLQSLPYQALLYEVQDAQGSPASLSPNWFGVAIPDPANFDVSSDVYVILYFHPTPQQSGALFNNADYLNKDGASGGTDWKQLFAFVDRLGGQMTAAIRKDKAPPNNRLVVLPFLESPFSQPFTVAQPYNLPTSEWVNVIHDILQDISATVISGLCTTSKKVVVAGLSNGSVYLDVFLDQSQADTTSTSIFPNIVEVWDFDSDVINPGPPAQRFVESHGIHERAYWQKRRDATIPQDADFVQLAPARWKKFPNPPPGEIPPLPPHPSNTNPNNSGPDPAIPHHYIRDTMFLDAVWNLANPNK